MSAAREADLYPPVKQFLVRQGYEVKAEIGACDLMARRGREPPVVVEMKLSFSLDLVLQGVARQAMFAAVYLAVPVRRGWEGRRRAVLPLCRRLGLGLLVVGPQGVEALLDPAPYRPRLKGKAAARLLREFERRVGDPNVGGTTGIARMTAYRQEALRCAAHLGAGPARCAAVRHATGVARATAMMAANHYGWFERVSRGVYGLTPAGHAALEVHRPPPDI